VENSQCAACCSHGIASHAPSDDATVAARNRTVRQWVRSGERFVARSSKTRQREYGVRLLIELSCK
jgi:hypothetical protein